MTTDVLNNTEKVTAEHSESQDKLAIEAAQLQEIDPQFEKRVVRKLDLHIIPWIFGIWLCAFIDRSNIGNAKIDGLIDDLKLDGDKFNIALVVFYIPYILIDVPSNWVVKKFRAGFYLPGLIIGWGLVSTFSGFTKSFAGLIVVRLFLGLCEGGLLGGIIVYLAMFYKRHEMLYRIGLFYCAAPLSGAFGGLLASGLSQIKSGGYDKWPWIFFIEGAITVAFGLLCLCFMPHTPSHSKFLTEQQRTVAMTRLKADYHGSSAEDDVNHEKFDWHWVKMAFATPNLWLTSLAWFFILIPLYSYSLFLPTIIRALGYQSTTAQLFTVPPNMCSFIFVLASAALSDKLKVRGPFMIVFAAVAIIGYALLLGGTSAGVRYGGTFLVAVGVFPCSPMVMGWLSNNTSPHYVRATATGFQIAFANCAAFVATFTYLPADGPDYVVGHSINLGALVLAIVTVICGIFYCSWENKQRDSGRRDHRLGKDEGRLGHRHPHFRYTI